MEPDALLSGLNAAQRAAVTTSDRPLAVLAGAGSGKTRVLTRRIAWRAATGDLDPRRVLALTFTRRAAGELRHRLRALGLRDEVAAGTFHGVAYAQLRGRWSDRGIDPPRLLDRKVGFVARLLPRSLASKGSTVALDVVGEIEWAKARMVDPADYGRAAAAAGRQTSAGPDQVARTFERYEQAKRDQRLVDFDDLLRLCRRDLDQDRDFRDIQRWRFRHLFVDEYQDVNPLQQALLDGWLGDNPDLCVVGDPNQAIYAWNGADARYLNEFTRRFPTAGVAVLEDNYRSSPQILGVANAVLAGAPRRPSPGPGVRRLRANRPDGPPARIDGFDTDVDEATGVARHVRDHHRPGAPWSAQAILVRTNAQVTLLESALSQAGIPFRVRGAQALLDQAEVKDALARLKRAPGSWRQALVDLEVSLGPDHDPSVPTPADATGHLTPDRRANVEAFIRLSHDYLGIDPNPSLAGFLAWLATTTRSDQPDTRGDAVELTTFHAAKGLEWPVVHLAGLEQGLVPIGHAKTTADLDEERRLFYVALTRAEQALCLTWARSRTFGSRTSTRTRSLFLDDVDIAREVLAEHDEPTDWNPVLRQRRAAREEAANQSSRGAHQGRRVDRGSRRRADTVGARGRGGVSDDEGRAFAPPPGRRPRQGRAAPTLDPADQALFEALRAWRAGAARAGAVPAYVIFHDATLAEIATTRPRELDDLKRVNGVGPVKAGRFGAAVLEVVSTHASGTPAPDPPAR